MIEFLQDYTTEALPPEHFTKGQQVTRSEDSERYFVGRGLAGYLVDGKLVDVDHRPIVTTTAAVEVVVPGDRRADLGFRAGEVMIGQPPRASSGPGVPFVEPDVGIAGSPGVVLEAEVERLKAELLASEEMFRDMNNSHVGDKDGLRADLDRLTRELADTKAEGENAVQAREKAVVDLAEVRQQHDDLVGEHKSVREQLDAAISRIAELEQQLADATAAKPARGK